jgi:hypothetical protein
MPNTRLPAFAKIEDRQLREAILNVRLFHLNGWSDRKVGQLIDVVEHILDAGKGRFPAFAADDLLTLIDTLEVKGYRPLHQLISQVGKSRIFAGLTLLAINQNRRDLAIQAANQMKLSAVEETLSTAKKTLLIESELATKWRTHSEKQKEIGRKSGNSRRHEAAALDEIIASKILDQISKGRPLREIASIVARTELKPGIKRDATKVRKVIRQLGLRKK